MSSWANIYRLGVKELWSLRRDKIMLLLICYTFTLSVYTAATALPDTLHNAPIAIVDEDASPLSARIIEAFYPPQFNLPELISAEQMDIGMDAGRYTFVITIPSNFQSDLLAGRSPQIQLSTDATRMSQAFTGSSHIQQMISNEINTFVQQRQQQATSAVGLELRARFNPTLEKVWFGSLMQIINNVTMLSIILTGAALIREREHGTIEHLLVMPVTPTEIMLAKVWAMGLVVLIAAAISLVLVIQGALRVPIEGAISLFLLGTALHLFATTAMGIFLATLARNMPQFGMLMILILLPLQLLSGGTTPRESMPEIVQDIMLLAPTTHYVSQSQAILYRGAGLDVVWPQFVCLALIGGILFAVSLSRFRNTINQMA